MAPPQTAKPAKKVELAIPAILPEGFTVVNAVGLGVAMGVGWRLLSAVLAHPLPASLLRSAGAALGW